MYFIIPVVSTVAVSLVVADSSLSARTSTLVSIVTISTSEKGNGYTFTHWETRFKFLQFFIYPFMGNIHVYKVWCKLFHFLNTFSSYSYSGLLYLCMCMLSRYQLANKSTLQESTFTYSTCYKLKMVRNQSGTYMINCLISPWIHDKIVVFSFQFH